MEKSATGRKRRRQPGHGGERWKSTEPSRFVAAVARVSTEGEGFEKRFGWKDRSCREEEKSGDSPTPPYQAEELRRMGASGILAQEQGVRLNERGGAAGRNPTEGIGLGRVKFPSYPWQNKYHFFYSSCLKTDISGSDIDKKYKWVLMSVVYLLLRKIRQGKIDSGATDSMSHMYYVEKVTQHGTAIIAHGTVIMQ